MQALIFKDQSDGTISRAYFTIILKDWLRLILWEINYYYFFFFGFVFNKVTDEFENMYSSNYSF